jgi:DNA-binding transcriptional LysR family regulator
VQDWVSYGADLPFIRRFWSARLGGRFDASLSLTVPDLRSVRDAVCLGMGVSILPDFLCQSALETGVLQQFYPSIDVAPVERWLMAYRGIDADRPELNELADALLERGAEPSWPRLGKASTV